MRLFIAVEIPDTIRKALEDLQNSLRPLTNSVRWIRTESIHITLKFIGEVAETRVTPLDEGLAGLEWNPIAVTVRGVGFFPNPRVPRIFWAGMEAPGMPELASEIDARLARKGFGKEKRTFTPHITLARAKNTRIDASLIAASSQYAQLEFGSFRVDRVVLFQSTLKPTGSVYSKLKEYLL